MVVMLRRRVCLMVQLLVGLDAGADQLSRPHGTQCARYLPLTRDGKWSICD